MNAGVFISPWGVVMTPVRPFDFESEISFSTLNLNWFINVLSTFNLRSKLRAVALQGKGLKTAFYGE